MISCDCCLYYHSWGMWADFPVRQHYKVSACHYECALSQVGTHPDVTVDVAKDIKLQQPTLFSFFFSFKIYTANVLDPA